MTVKYDKKNNKLSYNRKLKEGSGDTMYGLEVCKSLNIPDDFLSRAHEIRNKYNIRSNNILMSDGSHFNKKKIKKKCEKCNENMGEEIHHLQHQVNANNSNSYIKSFLEASPT